MILHGWDDLEDLKMDFFGYRYGDLSNPDPRYDFYRKAKAEADAEFEGLEVLWGHYSTGSYEGQAWVLVRKDGKLFEVDASHCSCYGLEQMWAPAEVTKENLLKREGNNGVGRFWPNGENFQDEVIALIKSL